MDDVSRLPYRGALRGKKDYVGASFGLQFKWFGTSACLCFRHKRQGERHPLPVVEKEEINFQRKMSLAEVPLVSCTGACGSEPKLQWSMLKIRNTKCLQTVMETEVRIHSMVHQPNIVQIMAVSYLKNSIYLVSELIKGRSLEELLFNDDESSNTFTIQSCS